MNLLSFCWCQSRVDIVSLLKVTRHNRFRRIRTLTPSHQVTLKSRGKVLHGTNVRLKRLSIREVLGKSASGNFGRFWINAFIGDRCIYVSILRATSFGRFPSCASLKVCGLSCQLPMRIDSTNPIDLFTFLSTKRKVSRGRLKIHSTRNSSREKERETLRLVVS